MFSKKDIYKIEYLCFNVVVTIIMEVYNTWSRLVAA